MKDKDEKRSAVYREERRGSPGEGTYFEEMRSVPYLGTLAET